MCNYSLILVTNLSLNSISISIPFVLDSATSNRETQHMGGLNKILQEIISLKHKSSEMCSPGLV